MNIQMQVNRSFKLIIRKFSQINVSQILREDNQIKCLENFKKYTKLKINDRSPEKHAAVLIPICIVDNKISLLFTLRSAKLRTYTRQVSFPGGVMDDTDGHEIECALRETQEEIGIGSEHIKIWGTGSQITPREGPSIVPVLGSIENFNTSLLTRNDDEVDKIFNVSIEQLIDCNYRRHTQFKEYAMPVYLGGEEKIWGMTAMITHFFLCSLLPKDLYPRRIEYIKKYSN